MIEFRKLGIRNIPKLLWVVIMVCYAFPFCLEFYISDNSLSESQGSFAWFICLIPSLIFSYYKGFKGGTFSIIFATLLHVFTRVVIEKEMMTELEYYIQLEVIIANILVALPVCFFVNKLQIENTKLEIAYKDLAHKKNEIKRLAYIDPLTQLPNRRFFDENLLKNLTSISTSDETLSILFIDLDSFKEINDTFGHDVGDLVLQQVAFILTSCVPENDCVVRLAGDEFIITLPLLDKEKAVKIASTILHELKRSFDIKDHQVMVTPSIGIAVYPEHGLDAASLIKHADKAMYQAKKAGKNNYAVCETVSQ